MRLREALLSAGFSVEDIDDPTDTEMLYAECCGEPVHSEAMAGGLLGIQRIWCPRCAGEVRQRDLDNYGVEQTAVRR